MHVRDHKKLRFILEERATTKNIVVVVRVFVSVIIDSTK